MDAIHTSRREAMKTLGALGITGGVSAGCASPARRRCGEVVHRHRTREHQGASQCHRLPPTTSTTAVPVGPEATLQPGEATVADYRLAAKRIGTTRDVIVQPSSYGIDNRLLLVSIAQLGSQARGVAVVNTQRHRRAARRVAHGRCARHSLQPVAARHHDARHGQAAGGARGSARLARAGERTGGVPARAARH